MAARPRENTERAKHKEIPTALTGMVLVVDDEEPVRDICTAIVEHFGFQAIGVADGIEALNIFGSKADEIALVILDLTMPKMDGVRTFHELKKIRPDVRVILSSGYSEQSMSERFTGDRPSGFIQKPYQIQELQSKIAQVMG